VAKLIIAGGTPLHGVVRVNGSKNGSLPLLAASLLVEGESVISNVPRIRDVETMRETLNSLGVACEWLDQSTIRVDASHIETTGAPYDLVRRMRASFYIAGPLLARCGEARVPLPGGCVIGQRPVDFHIAGFKALGAVVDERHGVVHARAERLRGTRIYLDPRLRSVGTTINVLMAATLAQGTTVIENAARDPDAVDCASFLAAAGASIEGIGTGTLIVRGVQRLQGCSYAASPDRMEAGTHLFAAAATGGDVLVEGARADDLDLVVSVLREAGAEVRRENGGLRCRMERRPRSFDLVTAPYPGFPTDLQPCAAVLAALADGRSVIEETIFEKRFNYVDELKRMGARIKLVDRTAIVTGTGRLSGAPVVGTDIRAAAALAIAALAAEGETEISGAEFLDRGYERFEEKLASLGADLRREGDSRARKAQLCFA